MVEMVNAGIGRSLGTQYTYTPSYCGGVAKDNPDFTSSISKFMQDNKPTRGFLTPPNFLREHLTATDFITEYPVEIINGQKYIKVVTSGNSWRYPHSVLADGDILGPEDLHINTWKRGANNIVSYFKPSEEGIKRYVEYPQRILYTRPDDTQLNKYITPSEFIGEIRYAGKAVSMAANAVRHFRNSLFKQYRERYNPIMADAADFLIETYGPTEMELGGIGTEKINATAKVNRATGVVVVSTDFYNTLKGEAEALGLNDRESLEAYIAATFIHESGHLLQPSSLTGAAAEIDLSGNLSNYYLMKAEQNAGTKLGRIYMAMAVAEKCLVKYWERVGDKGLSSINLESTIAKLEAEANRLGLEGNARSDYIAKNLEETTEDRENYSISEKHSEKKSGNYKERKSATDDYHEENDKAESGLEEITEEAGDKEVPEDGAADDYAYEEAA